MSEKVKVNGIWFWKLSNGLLTIFESVKLAWEQAVAEWEPNLRED